MVNWSIAAWVGSSSSGATPTSARVRTAVSSARKLLMNGSHSACRNALRSAGPQSATGWPYKGPSGASILGPLSRCSGVLVTAQSVVLQSSGQSPLSVCYCWHASQINKRTRVHGRSANHLQQHKITSEPAKCCSSLEIPKSSFAR